MSLSKQLFQLMLRAYPREFRLEYGSDMAQLFRDCYRDIHSKGLISAIAFWRRMILDVIRTAPLERWEALGRRHKSMKNLKSNVIGLVACVAVLVATFLLFDYGRKHQVGAFWMVALDAIVTAGVISNLIIFPLVILTRFSTFRAGIRVGGLNISVVSASYIVSFIFWLTFHWLRSQLRPQLS